MPGLPADAEGFLVTDDHARVQGVPDVYAAGDITAYPIKQGGIACQHADAAAEHIAARAGAPIEPEPFTPVLRGLLLTERWARFLRHEAKRTPPSPGARCGGRRPRSPGASWPDTSKASTRKPAGLRLARRRQRRQRRCRGRRSPEPPAMTAAPRVVVVGGGLAALEFVLALRELAGDRVQVTLVAPEPDFVLRPMLVAEPLGLGAAQRRPLSQIAADLGCRLVAASVASVDPDRRPRHAARRRHAALRHPRPRSGRAARSRRSTV